MLNSRELRREIPSKQEGSPVQSAGRRAGHILQSSMVQLYLPLSKLILIEGPYSGY